MNMPEKNTCIMSYTSTREAGKAVRKLQEKQFDMTAVSVVGNGSHHEENVVGIYSSEGNRCFRGSRADFWEYLRQLLNGELFLSVPGRDSIVAAGSIVQLLAEEHDCIDIHGFSVLGAALFTMGVPVESIKQYEAAIKSGKVLLIVNAERNEVESSCEILHSEKQQVTVHLA